MSSPIVIIGAGGHAKVVAEAILLQGKYTIAGFLDDKMKKGEEVMGGLKCIGTTAEFPIGIETFIVAIGNNSVRKKLYELHAARYEAATVIHPSACISKNAVIGNGTVVLAGAVIAYKAEIKENCIINSLSMVDHETIVGVHAHIAQGCIIGSNCSVPEGYTSQLGQKINSYTNLL
jgi:acetyltransferase EpsM